MRVRLLVLVVALVLATASCDFDWLMFKFGPARTGFSPDTSISKDAVQSSMVLRWVGTGGSTGSPAVANGIVYDGRAAFDAAGMANCSGSPTTCTPLWRQTSGGGPSSPAVANGVLYVGSLDHNLYAFDAAGTTNCSGSPKTCGPLWSATTGDIVVSSPAVADGVVYVGSEDHNLYAFDAAGITNCSGSPTTCAPLWTADTDVVASSPAVANGVVYVDSDKLYAFDAAGITNCSGSPKTCAPLWTAATSGSRSPAVANGVVYTGAEAFDAAGTMNCSGNPKTCAPLWTFANASGDPAVANGVVYAGSGFKLSAFDAAGTMNCSGNPKTCQPLWSATTAGAVTSPAVANGVVYVSSSNPQFANALAAFDAAGIINCSGNPKTCQPLWQFSQSTEFPVASSPAVSHGAVYVVLAGGLRAFGLERVPPTSSILIPSNGATLSGTATLDASASDNVRVSQVEFRLTGGSYNNALVGTATLTLYGWIAQWDTTSVPNGTYTLNSVASDPAGNQGRSPDIGITVQN